MDLSNMTPKDRMIYEVMVEDKEKFIEKLSEGVIIENFEEIIYEISRAEYKRGKADGIKCKEVAQSEPELLIEGEPVTKENVDKFIKSSEGEKE